MGGNSSYTFFEPDEPTYAHLRRSFIQEDLPRLVPALGIEGQPLPVLWTADFIPLDGPDPGSTRFVVGEFNCSCVGLSKFGAACGPDRSLARVGEEDSREGQRLCDLIGRKAIDTLSTDGRRAVARARLTSNL